jgi:hypothetical protein
MREITPLPLPLVISFLAPKMKICFASNLLQPVAGYRSYFVAALVRDTDYSSVESIQYCALVQMAEHSAGSLTRG